MDMGNGDPATGNAIMGSSIVTLLFIQVLLIALNAVFASAELAVLSVNETKLERLAGQGNKRAKRLYKLTQEPAKFLSTIQIAITLSGFLGSAFAADGFSDPLVEWALGLGTTLSRQTLDTIAVIFITLVLSYFTLIFGELVPKRIAMKNRRNWHWGCPVLSAVFRFYLSRSYGFFLFQPMPFYDCLELIPMKRMTMSERKRFA